MTPFAAAPTKSTVRELIIQNIVSTFSDPPPSPGDMVFSLVTRQKITSALIKNMPCAVGVYDTTEKVRPGANFEYRHLNVVLEFHAALALNDDPGVYLNHCLGQVQARMGVDIYRGGLAANTSEIGSELDIDGAFDKYVSGVAVFEIVYRCRPHDPYTKV